MEFIPFPSRHDDVARRETRGVKLSAQNEWDIAPGEYALLESFCSDDECDCRKIMIAVCSIDSQKIVATIGYGWENASFYTAWLYGDEDLGTEMAGSYLECGAQQSPASHQWLAFWKDFILSDEKYLERLREHYRLFKHGNP